MKKIKLNKPNIGRKQIMLMALVLALGGAIYLNWQFSSVPIDTPASAEGADSESQNLGVAELVNSQYIETVSDEQPEDTRSTAAVLSQARVDRQASRDEALSLLEDIFSDENNDPEVKRQAIDEASEIAKNMVEETDIESILRAKGIEDVVVCINEDSCSVMVPVVGDYSLIIQEAVTSQTDISPDSINIIEAN